ncbi:MAG: hypothetical protein LLG16_08350 [Euryarchaeota archaeon]|nr:hypothetical protein [Euryarchaeota archaeon]
MDNHKDDEFLHSTGINQYGKRTQTHDRSGWVVANEFAIVLITFVTVLMGVFVALGSWIFLWALAIMVLLDALVIYPYYQTLYIPPDIWR